MNTQATIKHNEQAKGTSKNEQSTINKQKEQAKGDNQNEQTINKQST